MPARTTTIARSDSRRRLIIAVATFLLVSFLVIRTSDAAFTATHVNENNEFSTGTIDLDSDETRPLFGEPGTAVADATNLAPGAEVDACIDIDYTGTIEAADLSQVTLDIAGPGEPLADALTVQVALYDACGGTELDPDIASGDLYDVAAADTGWTPDPTDATRGFHFFVEFDENAGNALQGESLDDVTITWLLETS